MEPITDAELVDKVRGGDKEAFGQLVERYQQMVGHIAKKMIADGKRDYDLTASWKEEHRQNQQET